MKIVVYFNMMNLSETLVKEIVTAIRTKVDPEKIILFGSAVRDDFSRNSDIDVALFGIDREQIYAVEDYLNQSIHSLKDIDIICFEKISNEKFKTRILKEGLVIYERNTR